MEMFSQNRQVKLVEVKLSANAWTVNSFGKTNKYQRLTEEYFNVMLPSERQTETKVHFDEYYYEGETYDSEMYERYTNGEDSPSYLLYMNAKSFGGMYTKQLTNIYYELNVYKKHEMDIHAESQQFTHLYHFF